jgi:protein involved in polysaccharide export with SLBB domain
MVIGIGGWLLLTGLRQVEDSVQTMRICCGNSVAGAARRWTAPIRVQRLDLAGFGPGMRPSAAEAGFALLAPGNTVSAAIARSPEATRVYLRAGFRVRVTGRVTDLCPSLV